MEDGHALLEEKRVENNTPLLERLERVIDTLSDNSVKMGQMLAVHDEKLDKQDRIDAVLFEKIESVHREINRSTKEIKAGCERDFRLVDNRLRVMEKKMWSIFGADSPGKGPRAGFSPVMGNVRKRKRPETIGRWSRSLRGKKSGK